MSEFMIVWFVKGPAEKRNSVASRQASFRGAKVREGLQKANGILNGCGNEENGCRGDWEFGRTMLPKQYLLLQTLFPEFFEELSEQLSESLTGRFNYSNHRTRSGKIFYAPRRV